MRGEGRYNAERWEVGKRQVVGAREGRREMERNISTLTTSRYHLEKSSERGVTFSSFSLGELLFPPFLEPPEPRGFCFGLVFSTAAAAAPEAAAASDCALIPDQNRLDPIE